MTRNGQALVEVTDIQANERQPAKKAGIERKLTIKSGPSHRNLFKTFDDWGEPKPNKS